MILRADGLRKSYSTGVVAVSHAELKVEDGEFISIVGRSGSGKSTLLAMIGALMRPTDGQVLLGNDAIWTLQETELADLRCREFGFVFQFPSLLPNLQVIDNVALPALLGRTLNTSDAYSRANILLERTGLGDRIDAYPAELSGGEQRRVAIARALINRPRLLLADEPTGDLDEDTENDIIAVLERLRQETPFGLVLVTHNLALAKRADRTFVMERGVLGAIDLPPESRTPAPPARRFAPPPPANDLAPADTAYDASRLGRSLWVVAGAVIAAGYFRADLRKTDGYQTSDAAARDQLAAPGSPLHDFARRNCSAPARFGRYRLKSTRDIMEAPTN